MVQPPKPPPAIILTGAGFSRNWGGWLANEAFEYLLGCSELNDRIRNLLWVCYDDRSGFEGALARLQSKPADAEDTRALTLALRRMFDVMNGAYGAAPGPELGGGHKAAAFLGHFDAIFTLNQDELIERRYSPPSPRWNGLRLPGTALLDPHKGQHYDLRTEDTADNFKLAPNLQSYFKLHGSSSFRTGGDSDDALLIMGGDKLASIDGSVLLRWYRDEFIRHLAIPDTRLLIIGYELGDLALRELRVVMGDLLSLKALPDGCCNGHGLLLSAYDNVRERKGNR